MDGIFIFDLSFYCFDVPYKVRVDINATEYYCNSAFSPTNLVVGYVLLAKCTKHTESTDGSIKYAKNVQIVEVSQVVHVLCSRLGLIKSLSHG